MSTGNGGQGECAADQVPETIEINQAFKVYVDESDYAAGKIYRMTAIMCPTSHHLVLADIVRRQIEWVNTLAPRPVPELHAYPMFSGKKIWPGADRRLTLFLAKATAEQVVRGIHASQSEVLSIATQYNLEGANKRDRAGFKRDALGRMLNQCVHRVAMRGGLITDMYVDHHAEIASTIAKWDEVRRHPQIADSDNGFLWGGTIHDVDSEECEGVQVADYINYLFQRAEDQRKTNDPWLGEVLTRLGPLVPYDLEE